MTTSTHLRQVASRTGLDSIAEALREGANTIEQHEATEGPGWHLTWDGSPVAPHDGPRYWMHCPADPDTGADEDA